ncbi:hypothetical protein THAOC_28333, partial [Thalassiosira oceanica]
MPTTTRTRLGQKVEVEAPALPPPNPLAEAVAAATVKRGAESEMAAVAAKKPRAETETPHDGNVASNRKTRTTNGRLAGRLRDGRGRSFSSKPEGAG